MKPYNIKKAKLLKLILIFMFFGISGSIYAQTHSVTGTVKDAESDESIPGAQVVEVGTENGTMADVNGNFTLELSSPAASLEINYIGYETLIISVNNQSEITVMLNISTSDIEEVVVIGYGTQKKKVVTGSISTVKSDQIASTPVLRTEQALQGRTAGVQVTNLSGQPGEKPTIIVRGIGSTRNFEPLYIVDGMPVSNIDYLNPGDIESIDVLKDAASAAIYGARAANGVVLITTKTGKQGKVTATYSGYYGMQNVVNNIDMLNTDQYIELMNEGAERANRTLPFDPNEIQLYDTDWQNELFGNNVPMTNHEFSIAGGNEKSVYSASISYFSQQGIIGGEKSHFDRYTGRLNTTHQVNKFIRFGASVSYSHIATKGISSNTSFNGAFSSALNMDPLTPVFETNPDTLNATPYSDNPVITDESGNVYAISKKVGAEIVNPLALIEIQRGETRVDKILGNTFGEIEIIKGLKIKTTLGIDLAYVLGGAYTPLYYLNGAQKNIQYTRLSKNIDRYYTWQNENTINYSKSFGNHNISVLVGTSASKYNYENMYGQNSEIPENLPYLNMSTDTLDIPKGGADHTAWLSQFGRVLYDYKGKYAFTGIIRRDGSTIFGPDHRYGIFPSVGVSWAISDEGFFPKSRNLQFLKLRASWGRNGNDKIGTWQYLSVMDFSRSYILSGSRLIGASPQYIENPELHWEESEQIDIAIDVSAFRGRLSGTIDLYQKTTNGLLEIVSIPGHVGNAAPYANVGSVQNKGIELSVSWKQTIKDLSYSVNFNGAYNHNEMTEIANDEGVIVGANWAVAGAVTRAEEGLPIGYFYGYKTDGIFQSQAEVFQHIGSTGEVLQPSAEPGDVKFIDVDGDGSLTKFDRTMIGNPIPDFTFGLDASVSYKNFDFSLLLTGTLGNEIFNGSQRHDIQFTNWTTKILDRWTEENPSDEVPRYIWGDPNNNYQISDMYIEDGSYLRVKNVQLGYNIPAKVLNVINATKWRVYVSAENLFTLTKYTGADPEIGAFSSFDIGIDRGIYPQARIIRFGTSITF